MEAFAKALADLNAVWYLVALAVVLVALFFVFRSVKKLRPYTGQLLLLSAFLFIALVFFLLTFSFKVSKMAAGVSARSMPRLWIFLLVLSAAMVLIDVIRGNSDPDKPLGRWQLGIAVLVLAVVSVALFNTIGYYISSGIFLVCFMLLLGERKPVMLISVPICWGLFTYFVFNKFLFITLPAGSLFSGLF